MNENSNYAIIILCFFGFTCPILGFYFFRSINISPVIYIIPSIPLILSSLKSQKILKISIVVALIYEIIVAFLIGYYFIFYEIPHLINFKNISTSFFLQAFGLNIIGAILIFCSPLFLIFAYKKAQNDTITNSNILDENL